MQRPDSGAQPGFQYTTFGPLYHSGTVTNKISELSIGGAQGDIEGGYPNINLCNQQNT